MLFADVRHALIGVLRSRVQNGELTERGLARLVGVSQPHIHNVLKGARALSIELSDQILQRLHLSVLDLFERKNIEAHMCFVNHGGYIYVPLLRGRLGPGFPWPTDLSESEFLPFPREQASVIPNPIAARLAEDSRMRSVFAAGDIVLLDQSQHARTEIEHGAYYVVKWGVGGIIRRVEASGGSVYFITEDSNQRPSASQKVHLDGRPISQLVRARAHFINPFCEWA